MLIACTGDARAVHRAGRKSSGVSMSWQTLGVVHFDQRHQTGVLSEHQARNLIAAQGLECVGDD